jgi:hypothetical protein
MFIRQSTYARNVLLALVAAGFTTFRTDIDGQTYEGGDVDKVMADVKDVECCYVGVTNPTTDETGWVFFVWQGPDEHYADGDEIVSDYTMNLDRIIKRTRKVET